MPTVSHSTDCRRFPDEDPDQREKRWLYLVQNCSDYRVPDYTVIRITGIRITQGSGLPVYGLHRDPDYQDPDYTGIRITERLL